MASATQRLPQILLGVTFIGFSWLAMQVVHEAGHVLVARFTGAEVTKVALHPLISGEWLVKSQYECFSMPPLMSRPSNHPA